MGSGQAFQRDFATGVNFGASDPRKDGAALAEMSRGNGETNGRHSEQHN